MEKGRMNGEGKDEKRWESGMEKGRGNEEEKKG